MDPRLLPASGTLADKAMPETGYWCRKLPQLYRLYRLCVLQRALRVQIDIPALPFVPSPEALR